MFKRLLFAVVLVLLISGLAVAGDPPFEHPETGEPLVIDCLRGTPRAIDGNLNDWQLVYMTPAIVDTAEQIYLGPETWDDPEDCSGEFYVMWDDTNIYLGAIVRDDDISNNKAGDAIWNADAVEVFFSTTNAIVGCTEHYQYGFTYLNQIWNWCNMDSAGAKEPGYLEVASTETDDGYICEVAIDYGQIKSLDFEAGETIGFHPVIDDTDSGGDRELQITWTGMEAHDQSQGYGHIILSSEFLAVSYKDKAALTWGAIKQ